MQLSSALIMNNPRNKYIPSQPAAKGGMLPLRALSPSSKDITDMYTNVINKSSGSLIPLSPFAKGMS